MSGQEEIRRIMRSLISTYMHMSRSNVENVAKLGNYRANYWLSEAANKYGIRFSMAEIEDMKRGV